MSSDEGMFVTAPFARRRDDLVTYISVETAAPIGPSQKGVMRNHLSSRLARNWDWPADATLRPTRAGAASPASRAYIERHIADADLRGLDRASCGVSVRSLHRAFNADLAGSVSNYISRHRLAHCAVSLGDPGQAHRSIIDICFSWGFNSTSHFSRLFKEQFGTTPREYRTASEDSSLARFDRRKSAAQVQRAHRACDNV